MTFIRQNCYLCPSSHPGAPLCWMLLVLYSFLISSFTSTKGSHLPALNKARGSHLPLKRAGDQTWLKPNVGRQSLGKQAGQVAGNLSISHACKGIFTDPLSEATLSLVKRCCPNSNSMLWMSPHTWEQSSSPWILQQELPLSELPNSALVNLLLWAQQILYFP